MSISGQVTGLAAWEHEARDAHGRWTSGAAGVIEKVTEPIREEGARGNSRAVSESEFHQLAAEGRDRLRAIQSAPWGTEGLRRNWPDVKARVFAEVQKPWGGATIDPRTGTDLPQGADKFAMSVKPSGMDTTSVPENASRDQFSEAMDVALAKYGRQLAKGGSYLGVFHDDDLARIDIDPVTVLDSLREVETIGAYTHAIGGAYRFSDGNGYWPPHVPEGAQMSGDSTHHWAGPGQWRSYAASVQQPHDEPDDLISEQARSDNDLISRQVDLGHSDAWRFEDRGPRGEWVKGSQAEHIRTITAGIRGAPAATIQSSIHRNIDLIERMRQQAAEEKIKSEARAAAAQAVAQEAAEHGKLRAEHAKDISDAIGKVNDTNKIIADQQAEGETEEKRKAWMKLAVESAVALVGSLLAASEFALGVPGLVAIFSALGPVSVQLITEFFKRL